jgi:two-component system nitrate/nitrite response regulator NarL
MPELEARPVEILLVDDHALFRESVSRLLGAEPGFHVAAHCGSIQEALPVLAAGKVDIVLLDYDLGQRNGMDFMRLARQGGYRGRVLVVTAGVEPRSAAELIGTGISGVFMKHNSAALLARAIRDVLSGRAWFDQDLVRGAVRVAAPADAGGRSSRLTRRERDVLSGVFEGLANKQIAGRIGVSESSVKATLQQLFAKTGVRTRSQLVRIALERYKDDVEPTDKS